MKENDELFKVGTFLTNFATRKWVGTHVQFCKVLT